MEVGCGWVGGFGGIHDFGEEALNRKVRGEVEWNAQSAVMRYGRTRRTLSLCLGISCGWSE